MRQAFEEVSGEQAELMKRSAFFNRLRQPMLVLLEGKETIYNIGSDKDEVTIKELADIIGGELGAEVQPGEARKGAPGAPRRVCLDISRIRKEFNFSPEMGIRDGIRRTIGWVKSISCLLYTSPSPRDLSTTRMPSSA